MIAGHRRCLLTQCDINTISTFIKEHYRHTLGKYCHFIWQVKFRPSCAEQMVIQTPNRKTHTMSQQIITILMLICISHLNESNSVALTLELCYEIRDRAVVRWQTAAEHWGALEVTTRSTAWISRGTNTLNYNRFSSDLKPFIGEKLLVYFLKLFEFKKWIKVDIWH